MCMEERPRAHSRVCRKTCERRGRRYFFTCNERECRERHAFDWAGQEERWWPRRRERGGGEFGSRVAHPRKPPFAVDFSVFSFSLFFSLSFSLSHTHTQSLCIYLSLFLSPARPSTLFSLFLSFSYGRRPSLARMSEHGEEHQ